MDPVAQARDWREHMYKALNYHTDLLISFLPTTKLNTSLFTVVTEPFKAVSSDQLLASRESIQIAKTLYTEHHLNKYNVTFTEHVHFIFKLPKHHN